MRYVFCEIGKATQAGFNADVHRTKGGRILLNEKEVIRCANLSGTLDERASALGGQSFSDNETKVKLKHGDWDNE